MNEDARFAALQRAETPHPDEIQHKKFRRVPRNNDCKILPSSDPDPPKPKPIIKKEEIPENVEIKKEPLSEISATPLHPHHQLQLQLLHHAPNNGEINGRDVEHVRKEYAQMRIEPKSPITPPIFARPASGTVGGAAPPVWRPYSGIPGNGEEPPSINQQSPTERRSAFKRHGSSPASENGRPAPPPGLPRLSLGSDVELTPVPNSRPHPHLVAALPHHPQPHIPPFAAALHLHRLQQGPLQQPAFPNLAHPHTLPLNYLQQQAALQLHLQNERRHQIVSSWPSKCLKI